MVRWHSRHRAKVKICKERLITCTRHGVNSNPASMLLCILPSMLFMTHGYRSDFISYHSLFLILIQPSRLPFCPSNVRTLDLLVNELESQWSILSRGVRSDLQDLSDCRWSIDRL